MKKIINTIVFLVVLLFLLVSCEKVTVGNNTRSDGKVNVCISFSDFNYTIEEDTRASDKTLYEAKVDRIALSVFNDKGSLVFSTSKSSSDDDFDQITCTIYPGDYTFVVVAHKASTNSENAAEIISPESAKITTSKFSKTFAVKQLVTIAADTSNEVVIDLGKRITSQFQMVTLDEQPDDVVTCEIIINSSAALTTDYSFNPTTGFSLDEYQYKVNINIAAQSIKGKSLGAHCLVNGDKQIVDVIVNMKDASGNIVKSHTFSDVPLMPHRVTKATGYFFNSSTKTSFVIDDSLEETAIIEF